MNPDHRWGRAWGWGWVKDRLGGVTGNASSIMVSSASTAALGYLFWVLAARTSSEHDVGATAATASAFTLVALLASQGWAVTLPRRLPTMPDHDGATFVRGAVVLSVLCAVVLGALATLAGAVRLPGSIGWVWFMLGSVATAVGIVADGAFVGQRAAHRLTVRNLVASGGKLAGLAGASLVGGVTGNVLAGCWVIGLVIADGHALRVLSCTLGPAVGSGVAAAANVCKEFLLHHIAALGGVGPSYALPVIVAAALGEATAGHFYVTWMTATVLLLASPAVASALVAAGAADPGAAHQRTRHAALLLCVTVLPGAIVLGLVGRFVLGLFGPGYAAAGYPLLILLCVSVVPDAVSNLSVALLRIRDRYGWAAGLNVTMATLGVAGPMLTVRAHGLISVGWWWLGSQLFGAIAGGVLVARTAPPPEAGRADHDTVGEEVR